MITNPRYDNHAHIDIPKGHVVVRFKVEGRHFDVAIPEDERDAIIESLGGKGASVVTDEGFDIDAWHREITDATEHLPGLSGLSGVRYASNLSSLAAELAPDDDSHLDLIRDAMASLDRLADIVEVPHLRMFEYSDRPDLDLGPVGLPRRPETPPGEGKNQGSKNRDPDQAKRKARKKAAKKSRQKNRRKK